MVVWLHVLHVTRYMHHRRVPFLFQHSCVSYADPMLTSRSRSFWMGKAGIELHVTSRVVGEKADSQSIGIGSWSEASETTRLLSMTQAIAIDQPPWPTFCIARVHVIAYISTIRISNVHISIVCPNLSCTLLTSQHIPPTSYSEYPPATSATRPYLLS